MIRRLKSIVLLLFLQGQVFALDYQYEYEDEPTPSLIEEVDNLQEQAALVRENHVLLLLEFSSPWCSYCETLEKEILEPMLKDDRYRDQLIIRKLEVSDYNRVIDFSGRSQSSVNLAMAAKVKLYPTLVFYNGKGEEVGQRLVGITVLEFAADEIDKALLQAQNMR